MAIYGGNKLVQQVFVGNNPVKKIYKGSTLIWTNVSQEHTLTLIITTSGIEDGTAGFSLSDNNGKLYEIEGEYSLPHGITLTLSLWNDEGSATATVNGTDYSSTVDVDIDVTSDITMAIHISYATTEEPEVPEEPDVPEEEYCYMDFVVDGEPENEESIIVRVYVKDEEIWYECPVNDSLQFKKGTQIETVSVKAGTNFGMWAFRNSSWDDNSIINLDTTVTLYFYQIQ